MPLQLRGVSFALSLSETDGPASGSLSNDSRYGLRCKAQSASKGVTAQWLVPDRGTERPGSCELPPSHTRTQITMDLPGRHDTS